MSRIADTFAKLKATNHAAFVPFVTAGDPDFETSAKILEKLPQAGADVIELGIPFSDPMADGPTNQASYLRALAKGMTLAKLLELVRGFRKRDGKTPVVLMGAFNPIHAYGVSRFATDASEAGVDGLLIVDLPSEEDEVLRLPAHGCGIDMIRFLAPTTDDARLPTVLDGASGYLYYASIAGITGTKSVPEDEVRAALARIKRQTRLPVAVGFGIKTSEQAAQIAKMADGVIVGSAIVARVEKAAESGVNSERLVSDVTDFCRLLANSVHAARGSTVVS